MFFTQSVSYHGSGIGVRGCLVRALFQGFIVLVFAIMIGAVSFPHSWCVKTSFRKSACLVLWITPLVHYAFDVGEFSGIVNVCVQSRWAFSIL